MFQNVRASCNGVLMEYNRDFEEPAPRLDGVTVEPDEVQPSM